MTIDAKVTLTVAEIIDLAEFVGLSIEASSKPDDWGMETEISIGDCPMDGVFDDEDDTKGKQYAHIAWCTEYPEEGYMGLGPELDPLSGTPTEPRP